MIAIDIALEQAAKEGSVDIAAIVSKMRSQRMKMVQTYVRKTDINVIGKSSMQIIPPTLVYI